MTKKPIVINLYGGPGAGKSTKAMKLTAFLKENGISAEYVAEYAKDMTWQQSFRVLSNQMYVFGKQQHKIWRCADQVEVVITDGALLNSLVYGTDTTSALFKELVIEEYHKFDNINVFLYRNHPYEQAGRSQNEQEAAMLGNVIYSIVQEVIGKFDYFISTGSPSEEKMFQELLTKLKK
jgi:nicotinamide riboside kinase